MFGRKSDKPPERYYLLPGQGGKAYRRKQKSLIIWSAIAALIVSGIFAALVYLIGNTFPH